MPGVAGIREKTPTEERPDHGVALSTPLPITRCDSATVAAFKARLKRRRRNRGLLIWTIGLAAAALVMWGTYARAAKQAEDQATIEQSKNRLSAWQHEQEQLTQHPVWRRFAPSAWSAFQKNIDDGQNDLARIQAEPRDASALQSLETHLSGASNACNRLLPETLDSLEKQSHQACPTPGHGARDPRDKVCQYGDHAFSVWKEQDGYHWRSNSGGNYKLSSAESKMQCPAL
ncbi:MAG TPA: hypothetical protein VJW20_01925 [Candidatus Angelobacter sp.]|nr:hypothetical protein [Candidatus Angelobacter sp.]